MEALERALARKQQAERKKANFKLPNPRTLDDVRRILAELAPASQPAPTEAKVTAVINGKKIETMTRSRSKREILLEGFDVLKNRISALESLPEQLPISVNGRTVRPRNPLSRDAVLGIDKLIKQWFGGSRHGLLIRWSLADGHSYDYDIYEHKLTRHD